MPSKARVIRTSCDSCGAKLVVRVQVVAKGRGKRMLETDEKAIREQVVNEVRKALGLRRKRKDAGKPKPKKAKAHIVYEEPQGEFGNGSIDIVQKKRRTCGCKATGRHKGSCALSSKRVAQARKTWAAGAPGAPATRTEVGLMAKAKLSNADKATPDGRGPRKRLSDKGKAAIAKLDPVRKPIKAGA